MLKQIFLENKPLIRYIVTTYLALSLLTLFGGAQSFQLWAGLTFGSFVAVLNFFEMALTFYRAVQMPVIRAQKFAVSKYVMRYFLTAVVLFVSFLSPALHPLGTVIGLLIIKGVIYTAALMKDKSIMQKDYTRKEE